jgi:hypothetical protein
VLQPLNKAVILSEALRSFIGAKQFVGAQSKDLGDV